MNSQSNPSRILAVSLSTRGLGYAVVEGENGLVDFGKKRIAGDKNAGTIAAIEKLITRNQPNVLVLPEVNAKTTHRNTRIKKLHAKGVALAKKHKIRVVNISGKQLRIALLGCEEGTKHEMAELLAKQFPDELAKHLPPKRKAWKSEDARMDIFVAVGLATAFVAKNLNDDKIIM